MAEVGALAYPVVLASMYGVSRLGRGEAWGAFEYMRLGALAALFGFVVAVQVKLAMLGLVATPFALFSAFVSLGGAGFLIGLYLWERWQRRALPPAPTAALPA